MFSRIWDGQYRVCRLLGDTIPEWGSGYKARTVAGVLRSGDTKPSNAEPAGKAHLSATAVVMKKPKTDSSLDFAKDMATLTLEQHKRAITWSGNQKKA
jgi:hypothetical protein